MRRLASCLAVGVFVIMAVGAEAASFQGLGDLPGGSFYSRASGLSANGSIVVGTGTSDSGPEAFRWTADGGMIGLGDLPGGGFARSYATDVSDDGSVVVGYSGSTASWPNDEAFRWTEGVGMAPLGDLPGGDFSSHANGVSADGSVVVGTGVTDLGDEAFRWTAGGGMVPLGYLPGDLIRKRSQVAWDVSDNGSIVVGTAVSALGATEAFRWTDGAMSGLGDLPGGLFHSEARAASSDGSVVVGNGETDLGNEAFRWTAADGMVGLGVLPGAGESYAFGVSDDGSVVVGYNYFGNTVASIWDPVYGMRALKDVLTDDLGLDLSGWSLISATAVSADGGTIVGRGTNPSGDFEAWRAMVDPRLHWARKSSGWWDVADNWFQGWDRGVAPTADAIVFIEPDVGLTVIGPADGAQVASLTIDAQTSGMAALRLQETGTLNVAGTTTVGMRGKLTGEGTLNAAGGMTNEGLIDLGDGGLQLVGGVLTNYSAILGDGQIDNPVQNADSGEIWGQPGKILLFTGAGNVNAGQINLNGGSIVFAQDLVNGVGGFIAGRGMLRVETLVNNGVMAFSGGFADIYGDVENYAEARIVVSGGSTATFYGDVDDNGGELRIGPGCSAVFFGSYNGGATGPGAAYIEGDLRPGHSPAAVAFGGDLELGPSATVEIELGGTAPGDDFDQVRVAGSASLDGTLDVRLIDDFTTEPGDDFQFMTFAARTGAFRDVIAEGSPPGLWFDVVYNDALGTATLVADALAGDLDLDGVVDENDLDRLLAHFGARGGAARADGDLSGDGAVDDGDLNLLLSQFGERINPLRDDAQAVPEPAALLLVVIGVAVAAVFGRKTLFARCDGPFGPGALG